MPTVDALRVILGDPNSVVFTDDALAIYLEAGNDSLFRAASLACKTLALEYSARGKSIKTDDLAIDVRGRGSDLLKVADSFAADALAADVRASDDFFDVVPYPGNVGEPSFEPLTVLHPSRRAEGLFGF